MHLPRRIFVTVLVVVLLLFCACVCEAQSSYDLNDAGIEMQSSYGGETGRRLQGSGNGATTTFPNAQCQANFPQTCFCAGGDDREDRIENSCTDNAFACACTQCCQAANISSNYANFVRPADAPECNKLSPYIMGFYCSIPLPVPDINAFRYQAITPLGCNLSIAWNYKDPDDSDDGLGVNGRDVVGFHANPQGIFSAVIDFVEEKLESVTDSFHKHTPYGGYELYADYTENINSVSMHFANKAPSNGFNSTLSLVPVSLQIDSSIETPLNASSSFWADEWYNKTVGAPQRCVMLGHRCDNAPVLWRLCRTGGYGQADAKAIVILLHSTFDDDNQPGADDDNQPGADDDDSTDHSLFVYGCIIFGVNVFFNAFILQPYKEKLNGRIILEIEHFYVALSFFASLVTGAICVYLDFDKTSSIIFLIFTVCYFASNFYLLVMACKH